jgi:O-glycosyl hydrolase
MYYRGAGTGEGSLLLVENPWTPNDWKTKDGFRLTTSFWWFAHFSKFIRPGMFRVDGRSKSADVLVAAFGGDNSAVTVVIINKARNPVNGITLSGLPSSSRTAHVFQTTMTGKMERLGPLTDSMVPLLPARSITTVTTEI